MAFADTSCQWGKLLFYLHLCSYCSRHILWLLRILHTNGASCFFYLHLCSYCSRHILWLFFIQGHVVRGGRNSVVTNGNCLSRLRAPLRTNIVLRCHSDH